MKTMSYIRLLRFRYHLSYITVIAGALLFTDTFTLATFFNIAINYITFNVLLYGGLYTFNDILDHEADAVHPVKKNRPIPSGSISIIAASIYCAILIATGLTFSYIFLSVSILQIYLLFIVLNLLYTLKFKHIIYLNLLFVAGTHTLRLILGAYLVQADINIQLIAGIYFMFLMLAITIHSQFNLKPKETPFYSDTTVIFLQLLCISTGFSLILKSADQQKISGLTVAIFIVFISIAASMKWLRPDVAKIFMAKNNKKSS
jgi:4-hydroxybenzoate polyprenyltransferase